MVWWGEAQVQSEETPVPRGMDYGFHKEELSLPEKGLLVVAAVSQLDDAGCENFGKNLSVQS